jgi:phage shock protein PspC (stress-responsive transcriptional regulator)
MELADELNIFAELRAKGALTDEEFARAKQRTLQGGVSRAFSSLAAGVKKFRLSRTDRWIGGVCGGLGKLTGVESWILRLVLAGFLVLGGAGLLAYVLLWIFVPRE